MLAQESPLLQLDARLPNPPILTCNEPLPLRLLVQKLNSAPGAIRISSLQIELSGQTHVRALDLTRTEQTSWPLFSSANMNLPLGKTAANQQTEEWRIPSRFWDNKSLPNTVAPSFETCNLSRTYDLEIRAGLQHSIAGKDMPELMILPLRIPVTVYSGVAPPLALLSAMAVRAGSTPLHPVNTAAANPQGEILADVLVPTTSTISHPDQSDYPAQTGSFMPQPPPADSGEAPPSYEDAIAEEIGPVDGPRRQYTMPEDPGPATNGFNCDSKSDGLRRQLSERLFSQNAPASPRRSTYVSSLTNHQNNSVEEETLAENFHQATLTPTTTLGKDSGRV